MSFFQNFINQLGLAKHDGRPLWKYQLSRENYQALLNELKFSTDPSLDPRAACLYYALWWKREYNGGKPSKEEIFNSIRGNINFNMTAEEFYKKARKGAEILGVKWIQKQNKLYFRTLLLQGGLPLKHIENNESSYLNFLLAVLEEQPETINDFIFNTNIIKHLPTSSRNDIIYENCLEIVQSIWNDENIYDDLINTDNTVKNITDKLKVKKLNLQRKPRARKPQVYWLMDLEQDRAKIGLEIGLADKYTTDNFKNILGFEPEERYYQLYLNDNLICTFRRLASGKYKTDWGNRQDLEWNGENILPDTYVVSNKGERFEIRDFIQTIPTREGVSLWAKMEDNKWRLIRGNGSPQKEAALLFPNEWKTVIANKNIQVYGAEMIWAEFEGEIEIKNETETRRYLCEVDSFDWTIATHRPGWMPKANMPVVQRKPFITIYDKNGEKTAGKDCHIEVRKHGSNSRWEKLEAIEHLSLGCIDLKIERNDITAYDRFFNIGNLKVKFDEQEIHKARVSAEQNHFDCFRLDETEILKIEQTGNSFALKVKTKGLRIPNKVEGVVGFQGQPKLRFYLESPFEGLCVVDKDGEVIDENDKLFFKNLHGLRVLSRKNREATITFFNPLKPLVKISKEIKSSPQAITTFEEAISKLFYLADAMHYQNEVRLELQEGGIKKTYRIDQFTHSLNVERQLEGVVSIVDENGELDLFAIPLNTSSDLIEPIPLSYDDGCYYFPVNSKERQFIVVSSSEDNKQLMPRFVHLDEDYQIISKTERIENYHQQLKESNFENEIWKEMLAYFKICEKFEIPFSTFDQVRAISRSSEIAAKAFCFAVLFHLSEETNFIEKTIPSIEQDLGFCFHWCKKKDWQTSIEMTMNYMNQQLFREIINFHITYFQNNKLTEVSSFLLNGNGIEATPIYNQDIAELRSKLGQRVLRELPYFSPKTTNNYGIAIDNHKSVKLMLRAPIAVAESIVDVPNDFPIWGGDDHRETIRRNIQYSQYLNQDLEQNFYAKTLLYTLKELN